MRRRGPLVAPGGPCRGVVAVCSLRRGVVVLSVPGALAGLLAAVGASRAVVGASRAVVGASRAVVGASRAVVGARTTGQGDASGGRRCVPATARRAGGAVGLGWAARWATNWPGTSSAIRGRRTAPAVRGPGGRARPRRRGGGCRRSEHGRVLSGEVSTPFHPGAGAGVRAPQRLRRRRRGHVECG